LVPGGYLVLGTGEGLLGISSEFQLFNDGNSIFYRAN
jgi:chemotaxis methyl-accepting protein methylase